MEATMRSEMQAPVYPAADLNCLRAVAPISAVVPPATVAPTTHWATTFAKGNVAEFGTKRQRLKECFD